MADNQVKINVETTGGDKSGALSGILDRIRSIAGATPGASAALAAFGTAAAGLAAVFRGASKSIEEFAQAQEKVAKLDAALAQNGILTDEVRERYQELASELQRTTAIADDEWLGVLTRLTQFGARPETIGMDIEAVKNLAGIVGDVTTAANLYSKALQGNFEAFGRYGIHVQESLGPTEKMRDLWKQLAQIGGGQLEAQAKSINGQWAGLKNTTSDLFESIGGLIARTQIVQQTMNLAAAGAEWFAEALGGPINQIEGLSNAVQKTTQSLESYKEQLAIVAELSERIAKAAEAEVKAIREKQQAIDDVAEAQVALDLARVDDAERSGKLTKRQAIGVRHQIRTAASAAKNQRANDADLSELSAKERAFADQTTLAASLGRRRVELEKRLAEGGPAESAANVARKQADAIKDEIRARAEAASMHGLSGSVLGLTSISETLRRQNAGFEGVSDQELVGRLRIAERISPASLQAQRTELAEVSQREKVALAKAGQLRDDLTGSLPTRIATRNAVFGLNQSREDILFRGQVEETGGQNLGAGLNNLQNGTARQVNAATSAVGALLGTNNMVTGLLETIARGQQQMEQKIRQIEAQVKNTHNR
jgi:hypothetical protein